MVKIKRVKGGWLMVTVGSQFIGYYPTMAQALEAIADFSLPAKEYVGKRFHG